MAAIDQFIANRLNAQKSISTRSLSMSLGNPADCFMQNKPNLLNAQMNVTSVKTKNYEQRTMNNANKNKAKQTQFKLEAQRRSLRVSFLGIFKPGTKQTQFQTRRLLIHRAKPNRADYAFLTAMV